MVSKKTKVLVISSMGPRPYVGGIENVIETCITSRLNSTYSFTIFDTYRKPDSKRTTFSKLVYASFLPIKCFSQLAKVKPKIVHIHFCSKIDFWKHAICLLSCKALGYKTVFHLHGGSFDSFYKTCPFWKQKIIRFVFRQSDITVALSQYWVNFIESFANLRNITVIPNPINCSDLLKYVRPKEGFLLKEATLLGSLGRRKGHYDVLKAAKIVLLSHPDAIFNFAGADEDFEATKKLKKLAEEIKVARNIRFLGPVAGEQKLKLLGNSGIIILPSYGENLPISVLEGMAAHKPVISTRVGAIPEVIKDQENGFLIKAGDWENLAKVIIKLFESPNLAAKIGSTAGEDAKRLWDIENITPIIDRTYKKLS